MPQVCTICASPRKPEIEAAMGVGAKLATISELFEVSLSAAGRHKRDHLSRVQAKPHGEHLQAADAMIVQARATRDFDAHDDAEALYLRTIAAALDARPDSPSLLHEFRATLASLKPAKQSATLDEQQQLAALIASITSAHFSRPGLFDDVYQAAIAAGASPTAAQAAAEAATTSPPAP